MTSQPISHRGKPVQPSNPLPVADVTQASDTTAVSAETVTFVGKNAIGGTGIISLDKKPILNLIKDKVGSYWGQNKVWRTDGSDTKLGKAVSITETATSADAIIRTSGHDLESLFESSGTGRFVIRVFDATGGSLYGWIGGIAESDDTYTFDVYDTPALATQSWVGTLTSFTGTPTAIEIYSYESSFSWITGTVLTEEKGYNNTIEDIDSLKLLSAGQYAIDYGNARILYKRAATGATDTCNYTTGAASTAALVTANINLEKIGGTDTPTDDSAMPATPKVVPVAGEYRAASTTYTDGDATVLQTDINGHLKCAIDSDIEIGAVEIKDGTTDARQAVKVDNETATATPTIALTGGIYKAALDTYDDLDASPLHTDVNGKLLVVSSTADALLTTIDADTGTIAGDTTSIDGKITACNTGAVVVASGAITETNSGTIAGDTTSIDGKITACNTGAVVVASGSIDCTATDLDIRSLVNATDSVAIYGSDDAGTTKRIIKTDAGGAIQVDLEVASVDVTSVVPGIGATNLGKAEDAAHTSGDVGVMALAVENEDQADLSTGDKDYTPIAVTKEGNVIVKQEGTISVTETTPITGFATSAKQLADDHNVTVSNMIPAVETGLATSAKQLADGHNVVVTSAPSTVVTATDLDIRDITEATDGIAIYGSDDLGTTKRIIKTDAGGAIQVDLEIASVSVDNFPTEYPLSTAQVTTLTPQTDALTDTQIRATALPVSATNLDIRDLTSASDSVLMYGSDDAGTTKRVIKTDAGGAIQVDLEVADVVVTSGNITETNSGTIAGDTTSIDGKITACNTGAVVVASGAITETNSGTIAGDTTSLDTKEGTTGEAAAVDGTRAAQLRYIGDALADTVLSTDDSAALEASTVSKAAAGSIYSVSGYNSGAAQFIQIHDAASLPADTAVPEISFKVPAATNFSWTEASGRAMATGIVVCNSSTQATKTIGSADVWFNVTYT